MTTNIPKLPQRLSDLLHLRYIAGERAKEGATRGLLNFETVGMPDCSVPGCLLGWLQATPEGREIYNRTMGTDIFYITDGPRPLIDSEGYKYDIFCINPCPISRSDIEELEYRLSYLDGEIHRECVKQGMCPEETPKMYAEALVAL